MTLGFGTCMTRGSHVKVFAQDAEGHRVRGKLLSISCMVHTQSDVCIVLTDRVPLMCGACRIKSSEFSAILCPFHAWWMHNQTFGIL